MSADWHTARADAVTRIWNDLQGYLVSITSAAENGFILNTFNPSLFGALWTGGTDVESEGIFCLLYTSPSPRDRG